MDPNQILKKLKNPLFWLLILLLLFITKGVLFSVLIPFFQGPDEAIHFAQMERWAEPQNKNWPIVLEKDYLKYLDAADIRTYHFPEEIIQTGYLTQFDEVKFQKENRQFFTGTNIGQNERKILEGNWKQYLDIYPPTTSDTWSLYYFFGSKIEKVFSEYSVFFRFFTIRFFSVLLGAGIVALSYLIARKINFNSHISFLFASLVAFQPMFSQTTTIISYDVAIIFSFSLFLYAVISFIKNAHWKHIPLVILSALLGFFSKGPGIVLIALLYPLFAWYAYQKLSISKIKFFTWLVIATIAIMGLVFLVIPQSYLVSITNFTAQSKFSSPLESIGKYLDKTLTTGELRDTTLSYWGQFGWLDNSIPEWSLDIIIFITIVGFIGTIWYLLSRNKITYLPERKYIIFFFGIITTLQIAIRFYDWRIFDTHGEIIIGQPGRYFLPNIIAHLLVVITGIGFLVRQEKRFVLALKILALAMILLELHAIVNVIIPRYYL